MEKLYTKHVTVKQFCKIYPWPTERGLRKIIYKAGNGQNKFQTAFKKFGRRVLIDTTEFWLCLERMQEK